MDELGRLLLDGRDHLWMRVTSRIDRDAGGEIEEEVAVDVLDRQALATNRDDRVGTGQAGRRPRLVERNVRASLWPGKFRDDMRDGTIPCDPRRARRLGSPLSLMHKRYAHWISRGRV